jgi:photosystem II stability/assembly factor-like uncharacterized protein
MAIDGWRPNLAGDPLPSASAVLRALGGWIVAGETTAENGIPPRRVFSTSNTGKTWAEHPFGEIPSNFNLPSRDAIQFADAQHGWLRGGNAFFYSSDGGSTWVQYH